MSVKATSLSGIAPTGLTKELADFWRWWTAQLASLLPRFKQPLFDQKGVRIEQAGHSLRLHHKDRDNASIWQHEGSLDGFTEDDWKQLSHLADDTPIIWQHDADQLLRLRTQLPAKAGANLEHALRLFVLNASPLEETAISWDFVTQRSDKQVTADIVIARNRDLDAVDAAFAEKGLLPPKHVHLDDEERTYCLRKPLQLGAGNKWVWPVSIMAPILALIAGLVITNILADAWAGQERAAAEELAATTAAKMQKEAALRVATTKARHLAPVVARPSIITLLEDVSANLPADAWVETFGYGQDGTIEFVVIAADGQRLKSVLDTLETLSVEGIEQEQLSSAEDDTLPNVGRWIISARART